MHRRPLPIAALLLAAAVAAAGAGAGPTMPLGAGAAHDDALAAMHPPNAELLAGASEGGWKQLLLQGTDGRLQEQMTTRLSALLEATHSQECAEEVALSFEAFMSGHLTETLLPFESPFVQNQCPAEAPQELVAQPTHKAAEDLELLYVILAHKDFGQVVRLIRALQEDGGGDGEEEGEQGRAAAAATAAAPRSHFVVHVDGKVPLEPGTEAGALLEYAATAANVHVMAEARVNVSWGGFSVVQATLNAMGYAFHLGLPFDRVINLSGATYPLATPATIRRTLARHPLHEQLMFIDPSPTVPLPRVWHYFVECDNAMHRVARFVLPRGLPLRTGSQWFIISRAFSHYLLTDDTLVSPYTAYAQHVLIPDESFFATLLLASPFCHFHANTNYLHLTFDIWEDEKGEARDRAKCLQPDPKLCGRSPKLVGADEVPALVANASSTGAPLFARKFESGASDAALAEIDARLARARAEEAAAAATVSIMGEGAAAAAAAAATCGGGAGGGCGQGLLGVEEEEEHLTESLLAKHGISLEAITW